MKPQLFVNNIEIFVTELRPTRIRDFIPSRLRNQPVQRGQRRRLLLEIECPCEFYRMMTLVPVDSLVGSFRITDHMHVINTIELQTLRMVGGQQIKLPSPHEQKN